MTEGHPTVLLVEDDVLLAEAYLAHLSTDDCEIIHVETGAAAIAAIEEVRPEVVLLDLLLPDMHGHEVVEYIAEKAYPIAIIVVTSQGSVRMAVEAMRAGAFDFLVKPIDPERLAYTLRNALERQTLTRAVQSYEAFLSRDRYYGFVGASSAMQAVYRVIDSAAASRATVLITGESGTGKELCAEAVHRQGPRQNGPFVPVNCAAIPKDLVESELFGHVKGAFTGAAQTREGAAARAAGGTLFFDEICEMPLELQPKLLRFIQTGSFQKVGGDQTETTDARFVCATNRDPLQEVGAGRFREDLYYRLNVVPLELPPLRERGNDVLLIARELLRHAAEEEGKSFSELAPETAALLQAYDWPGNVRQLENIVRNIVVLNEGEVVTPAMLPPPLTDPPPHEARPASGPGAGPGPIRPLAQVERQAIEEAIDLCHGNVVQAAVQLGVSNSTLYRKIRSWREA